MDHSPESNISQNTRGLLAEALGTGLLLFVIVGSGIAATQLTNDAGTQLVSHALVVGLGLAALIALFQPVSGAHFNPAVTLGLWRVGLHQGSESIRYVMAQIVGGVVGVALANLSFADPLVTISTTDRSGSHLWVAEFVATFVLVLLILGLVRTGRSTMVPAAVGAWVGSVVFAMSSTGFANPAVTVARMFTDSYTGISPSSVGGFLGFQILAALSAVIASNALFPEDAVSYQNDGMADGLAEKANTSLTAAAPAAKPGVLFLCVHNAGRSQMAAGWMRQLGGDRVDVYSGGSEPGDQVNPSAVAAMAERGIDISQAVPQPWNDEMLSATDVVVTMGCGDTCPVYPGKRYVDWELEDPAGKGVEDVRPVRDEIERRVRGLLAELGVDPGA